MSLPQPSVALNNICSTIFNNTLYTYSSSAFQSLSLTAGAKWKTLPYNAAVEGAVCVGSTPGDPSVAGFYVVGGTSSTADYTGLQKYTYSTGQWEVLTPSSLVTQNRLHHGAAYINATDSILVYSGHQDGTDGASQDAFTIQASAPYLSSSVPSNNAPVVSDPILLEWSATEVVMVGGSTSNTAVMLYDSGANAWKDSGATLLNPLTIGTSGMQAALISGDDNSKHLYTFDVTVAPNQVTHICLQDGTGAPVTNAGPSKRSEEEEEAWAQEFARRALTADDWPAYNASLAPSTTRTGFSVAQDSSGMVVLAGGGGTDVLCVFNGRTNAWRNATQMLSAKKALVQTTTTSSSSSSTRASSTAAPTTLLVAPSSSAASTTAAAPAASSSAAAATTSPSHNLPTNAVLGIVLGGVAAMGIVLIALYFCIMRRRKRRNFIEAAHNRRASGTSSSEKDAFAIANDSFTQRPNAGGLGTFRAGHQAQDSQGSFSSVAILMGRVNQPRPSVTIERNNSGGASNKRGSNGSLFNKGFKGTISRPIPQDGPSMSANNMPRQMQFERGAAAGIGAGAAAAATGSYGRSVTDSKQQQQEAQQANGQSGTRRSSGWNRYWSGGSALNMLGFGAGNGQNSRSSKRTTVASDASSNYSTNNQNRITQDSATVPPLDIPGMPEAKPRFQRVNSGSPTISNYDNYLKDGMQGKIVRSTSQTSSHSGYSSGIPASVHDMWDPTSSSDQPWGANRAPSSAYGSSSQVTSLAPASGSGGKKSYVPTGMSRQPQLAMADTSSDMSWLNLGDVNARV